MKPTFTIHNADGSRRQFSPATERFFHVTNRTAAGQSATTTYDHQHVLSQIPSAELDAFIEWLHMVECDEAIIGDLAAAIREWGRSDLGNTKHYIEKALAKVQAAQLAYTTRTSTPVYVDWTAEEQAR